MEGRFEGQVGETHVVTSQGCRLASGRLAGLVHPSGFGNSGGLSGVMGLSPHEEPPFLGGSSTSNLPAANHREAVEPW